MVFAGRHLRSPRRAIAGVRHAIWAKRQQRAMRRLAGRELLDTFAAAYPEAGFLEIGANDGGQTDHLHRHASAGRWHGTMVEPQPEAFRRLRGARITATASGSRSTTSPSRIATVGSPSRGGAEERERCQALLRRLGYELMEEHFDTWCLDTTIDDPGHQSVAPTSASDAGVLPAGSALTRRQPRELDVSGSVPRSRCREPAAGV